MIKSLEVFFFQKAGQEITNASYHGAAEAFR